MTEESLIREIERLETQRVRELESVVQVARSIVPTLRDMNMAHAAETLDRAIFALDSVNHAWENFLETHRTAVARAVLEAHEG